MRILIVEDEPRLAKLLCRAMEEARHTAECVHDGRLGLERARAGGYDLLILDWLLPGLDGLSLCRRLREEAGPAASVPVLMLTARDAVSDRVAGLDAGADDYLTKPFSLEELAARVRALERRIVRPLREAQEAREIEAGGLRFDPELRTVRRPGQEREVRLTVREAAVLECFLRHPGQVLSRGQILRQAWDDPQVVGEQTVDSVVYLLRKKLEPLEPGFGIRSVRGLGYRLEPDGRE
ncbi:MAG: response regulator transcription factor [Firmicutes bacterium]|nr:response regulator transcription factor [Bacillota bacterium]